MSEWYDRQRFASWFLVSVVVSPSLLGSYVMVLLAGRLGRARGYMASSWWHAVRTNGTSGCSEGSGPESVTKGTMKPIGFKTLPGKSCVAVSSSRVGLGFCRGFGVVSGRACLRLKWHTKVRLAKGPDF